MTRESSRDILLAKNQKLKSLNAGFGTGVSDNPFRYIADDGTPFSNVAEMTAHNLGLTKKALAQRTFQQEKMRLYRRA